MSLRYCSLSSVKRKPYILESDGETLDLSVNVDIDTYQVKIKDVKHVIMSSKEHMNINDMDLFNIKTLTGIHNLNSLRSLYLKTKSNSIINNFVLPPSLVTLQLSINLNNRLDKISNLVNLEHLEMRDCNVVDISSLQNLQKLEFIDMIGNEIGNYDVLKKLPNLKFIRVGKLKFIGDGKFLVKHIPDITDTFIESMYVEYINQEDLDFYEKHTSFAVSDALHGVMVTRI